MQLALLLIFKGDWSNIISHMMEMAFFTKEGQNNINTD